MYRSIFSMTFVLLAILLGNVSHHASAGTHPGMEREASMPQDSLDKIPADHHTHIFGPEVRNYLQENVEGVDSLPPLDMEQLLATMEQAPVGKAVILSNAYFFAGSGNSSSEQQKAVMEENDRVWRAVSEHPDKAIGFFAVNPLSTSALDEIERNASKNAFAGLKLHLANSEVDLRNEHHLEQLSTVFKAAEQYDLAIIVHLRPQQEFGEKEVEHFIDEVLLKAPDVPVQIAHLSGWGGYDEATD